MPSESLRNLDVSQFQVPPRQGKGDIEGDVLMSERERQRIRRIVELYKSGHTAERITRLVCCPDAATLADEMNLPTHEIDNVGWNDGSGLETSPAERQQAVFSSRLAWVKSVIEKYGEGEPADVQSNCNRNTRRTDCIAPAKA